HRRHVAQQLPDRRLDLVDDRARPRPLIARRLIGAQRVADGIACDAQMPRDGADTQLFSSMEPTDLGPVLQLDHPSFSLARIGPGFESRHLMWWTREEVGQFSGGDTGSVFRR